MPPRELLCRLGRFVAVFILILIPGFWLREVCAADVRALVRLVCADEGLRRIEFETGESRKMRIVILNRALMARDGSGPVRNLDVNPVGLIWVPVALLGALVFMAPASAARRATAAALGCGAQQVFVAAVLSFAVWHNSAEIGLGNLSPWLQATAPRVSGILLHQITFAGPVVVWFLVAFRREDWSARRS